MHYGVVARKVKPWIRIQGLDFAHHRLVAKMDPAEQQRWLAEARESGLLEHHTHQRIMDYGWVARQVTTSVRTEVLNG
jgi:hypothetical protein